MIECKFIENESEDLTLVIPDGVWRLSEKDLFYIVDDSIIDRIIKVVLPDSLKVLGTGVFCNFQNLQSINLPVGLEEIESEAFFNCCNLQNIELPEGLHKIGKEAFGKCSSLEEITIPKSICKIEDGLFDRCYSLKRVNLHDDIAEIGFDAFRECTQFERFDLPRMTTSIPRDMLRGCASLETLNLHDELKFIGEGAFAECLSLKSVELPESVEFIKLGVFYHCSALEYVSLPREMSEIERLAFFNCINLKEVNLPDNLVTIGTSAFEGCRNLTEMVFPQTFKQIKNHAFQNCRKLKRAVMPPQMEEIESAAFNQCYALEDIGNTEIKNLGAFSFVGCNKLQVNLADGGTIDGRAYDRLHEGSDVIISLPQPSSFELERMMLGKDEKTYNISYSVKKDSLILSFKGYYKERDPENMSRIINFAKDPTYENLIKIKDSKDKMLLAAAFNGYNDKFVDYSKKYIFQMLDYIEKTKSYYLLDYMLDKKVIGKRTIGKAVDYASSSGGELYATLVSAKNEMGAYKYLKRLEL